MSAPIFTPPRAPSPSGTSNNTAVKAKIVQFGDGYTQRQEKGINSRARSQTWSWRFLDFDEAEEIRAFLSTNALSGFQYQLPGDTLRNWRVDGTIAISYPDSILADITVSVVEDFWPS